MSKKYIKSKLTRYHIQNWVRIAQKSPKILFYYAFKFIFILYYEKTLRLQ